MSSITPKPPRCTFKTISNNAKKEPRKIKILCASLKFNLSYVKYVSPLINEIHKICDKYKFNEYLKPEDIHLLIEVLKMNEKDRDVRFNVEEQDFIVDNIVNEFYLREYMENITYFKTFVEDKIND